VFSRCFQDIDYEGFRKFLNSYLEIETPDELCRHLFLSFVRKGSRGVDGKAFKVSIAFSNQYKLPATYTRNALRGAPLITANNDKRSCAQIGREGTGKKKGEKKKEFALQEAMNYKFTMHSTVAGNVGIKKRTTRDTLLA